MKMWKKIVLMLLANVLLSAGAFVVYSASLLTYSNDAFSKTYKKLETTDTKKEDVILATKPFSILLMGVDVDTATRGGGWEGRSDSMLVVTINPVNKKTTMMSLTRDTMVEIANPDGTSSGTVEKLNHSYAYGEAPMTMATIEKMLDIDIDHYVKINMDGLMSLVDALGGITVNNTLGFPISIEAQEPAYTATVDPGVQHVNGSQALVYARMRYDDPEGDIGRQKRQREVIEAIVKKLLQLDGFTQYKGILDALSNNIQTDIEISTSTLPSLLSYQDSIHTIESYQLSGEGEMVDGIYYSIPSSEHLLEMQNILKTSLGLPTSTELRTNVQVYELVFGTGSAISVINPFTTYAAESEAVVTETSETGDVVEEPTYTE